MGWGEGMSAIIVVFAVFFIRTPENAHTNIKKRYQNGKTSAHSFLVCLQL
jgi:hypothetical protein